MKFHSIVIRTSPTDMKTAADPLVAPTGKTKSEYKTGGWHVALGLPACWRTGSSRMTTGARNLKLMKLKNFPDFNLQLFLENQEQEVKINNKIHILTQRSMLSKFRKPWHQSSKPHQTFTNRKHNNSARDSGNSAELYTNTHGCTRLYWCMQWSFSFLPPFILHVWVFCL